ncbi:sensor protein of zinc sigma-54-dependent two-component system [Klebsiella pneumoniae]|uniref:Sensor protein of zinc sigma-54-dependent two-component system n=1 Tax=Klebsiella pneumoniae TaxID=573 RepID=A0A378CJL9_KLEPN|nr:sensor protein of zinc sigma-54-dependent two-component system [Klebsiella pneumoniae]
MKIKSLSRDAAAGALSWLLTGTVVLLVMLFSAMIVRDYGPRDDRCPTNH